MSGSSRDVELPPRPAARWVVPERLRPYVREPSAYSYDPGAFTTHRGMPTTTLTMVIPLGRPLDVGWFDRAETRGRFWAMASGLSTRTAVIHQVGHQEGISLGLTPAGARALFGVPAAELHGRLLPFADLLGERTAERWYADIAEAPDWEARFAALERHLLARLDATGGGGRPRPEVAQAWWALTRDGDAPQVTDVARAVGWSRRHLGEQFRNELGITPTDARRLARFGRSHRMARSGAFRLADIAAECGYADQAHMTREWQAFCGAAPTEWAATEFPFVQDEGTRPDAG